MEISALQKERAAYLPKLPMALRGAVKVKEGKPTHSVDNQDEIKKLFPNTYGLPLISFEPGETMLRKRVNVGVILSGGQAPGGHNVISGLFDRLKQLDHRKPPLWFPHRAERTGGPQLQGDHGRLRRAIPQHGWLRHDRIGTHQTGRGGSV